MPDHDSDQAAERRERIRFQMDIVKTLVSIGGLAALLFAFASLRAAQEAQQTERAKDNLDAYRTIVKEWTDHQAIFVEQPRLRPYFFEKKALKENDPLREKVLALSSIRLDIMDGMLMSIKYRGWSEEANAGWYNTFSRAFYRSPALCATLASQMPEYGLIGEVGRKACRLDDAGQPIADPG